MDGESLLDKGKYECFTQRSDITFGYWSDCGVDDITNFGS